MLHLLLSSIAEVELCAMTGGAVVPEEPALVRMSTAAEPSGPLLYESGPL